MCCQLLKKVFLSSLLALALIDVGISGAILAHVGMHEHTLDTYLIFISSLTQDAHIIKHSKSTS